MSGAGRIGLVGGSGLYDLAAIAGLKEERLDTPFGPPSDSYFTGTLDGVPVAFLSRHARGHRLSPTEINYRANVCGFKMLGCDALLSASACGSLREEYAPRHAGDPGPVHRPDAAPRGHASSAAASWRTRASPIRSVPSLSEASRRRGRGAGLTVHRGGTYVCMEGPQFSTRAESNLYRAWGADVIGMTNLTEARLAREAEICYASLALVTDYDCWRDSTEDVSVEVIVAILGENAAAARRALAAAVARVDPRARAGAATRCVSESSRIRAAIPDSARERLRPIAGRYL